MVRMSWLVVTGVLMSLACAAPGTKDEDGKPITDENDTDADADTDADTDADPPDYTWTAVTINFDDIDGDQDVTDAYDQWVVFETERGYTLNSWDYSTYSRSEPSSAYTSQSPGGAGAAVDLTFRFAAPVRELEFYTLGDQTNGVYATVDVETESGDDGSETLRGDGGATSAERCDLSDYDDIVSITIRDIEDPYSVNFDDISFEIRSE